MRTVGGAETTRHILIDGNNILRRVYYAFVEAREKNGEPPIVDRKGVKIGIVYGFFSFLPSLLYDLASPTKISLFLDGKPTKRLEMDASYKDDDRKSLEIAARQLVLVVSEGRFPASRDTTPLGGPTGCGVGTNSPERRPRKAIDDFSKGPGSVLW